MNERGGGRRKKSRHHHSAEAAAAQSAKQQAAQRPAAPEIPARHWQGHDSGSDSEPEVEDTTAQVTRAYAGVVGVAQPLAIARHRPHAPPGAAADVKPNLDDVKPEPPPAGGFKPKQRADTKRADDVKPKPADIKPELEPASDAQAFEGRAMSGPIAPESRAPAPAAASTRMAALLSLNDDDEQDDAAVLAAPAPQGPIIQPAPPQARAGAVLDSVDELMDCLS
jgi:hypothetical protein